MSANLNVGEYDEKIISALEQIEGYLHGDYQVSTRMIALLLLQDDREVHKLVKEKESTEYETIQSIISKTKSNNLRYTNFWTMLSTYLRITMVDLEKN